MSDATKVSVLLTPANLQIVNEFDDGKSAAVNKAVEHWISCTCKINILEGKLKVCEYCAEKCIHLT